MVMMQGTLWKWTNYLSGWQPRWFVLDYGVMTYYHSQDDVHSGSRGSIKMACCEILINPSDQLRIDLKIPKETVLYLKASNAAERQKWLVALGTAKACIVDSNLQQQQQVNSLSFLKNKMLELIMCKQLMMEQVNIIKAYSHPQENEDASAAMLLLSTTCDSFIANVDDIMEIVDDNLSVSNSPMASSNMVLPLDRKVKQRERSSSLRSALSSHESTGQPTSSPSQASSVSRDSLLKQPPDSLPPGYKAALPPGGERGSSAGTPGDDSSISSLSTVSSTDHHDIQTSKSPVSLTISKSTVHNDQQQTQAQQIFIPEETVKVKLSFFSTAPHRFEDVHIGSNGLIPTKPFLDACSCIIPVFDKLSPTAFAPVKIDIQGNIKKIETKYTSDVEVFEYLQNIVSQELNSNEHTARNSATDALLWLKRGLEFVSTFLEEVSEGERDLVKAAGTAYSKSLRKFHGWMVRGVFNLALKACPYYADFMKALRENEYGVSCTEADVLREMTSCVAALSCILGKINHFYRKNKLDADSVV